MPSEGPRRRVLITRVEVSQDRAHPPGACWRPLSRRQRRRVLPSTVSRWICLDGFRARTCASLAWEGSGVFGFVDAPDLDGGRRLYRELHPQAGAPNDSHFDVVADSNRLADFAREDKHYVIPRERREQIVSDTRGMEIGSVELRGRQSSDAAIRVALGLCRRRDLLHTA